MVLFLCLIPNRGARIGHQSHDHFKLVTYCKKNNFNFVYHPFTCNSSSFENILNFGSLHTYHYNDIKSTMKTISIKDLNVELKNAEKIHVKLLELHNEEEKIMLFDSICGNEKFPYFNIKSNDIIEVRKSYRGKINFKNYVNKDYICIHIRCGDIINDKSRYLSVQYFVDTYKILLNKINESNLPVYIVTENNFKDDAILKENINNCIIIKDTANISFCYLVHSKYLIVSRSGFSNLAYTLGNMKIIKPPNDWNCYYDNIFDISI